jgi:hypothetical protein
MVLRPFVFAGGIFQEIEWDSTGKKGIPVTPGKTNRVLTGLENTKGRKIHTFG